IVEVTWLRECVRIDPIRRCLARWLRISDKIRESHSWEAEISRKRVVSIEWRKQGQTATQANRAGHLPIAENLTNHGGSATTPVLTPTIGQVVHECRSEALRDIMHAN